jgi:hypothetical protein
MEILNFNKTELTKETIKKTDKHFADICQGCIDEVLSGDVWVNDKKKYISDNKSQKQMYLSGEFNRNNFTYLQCAYWIQTGENIALLS